MKCTQPFSEFWLNARGTFAIVLLAWLAGIWTLAIVLRVRRSFEKREDYRYQIRRENERYKRSQKFPYPVTKENNYEGHRQLRKRCLHHEH